MPDPKPEYLCGSYKNLKKSNFKPYSLLSLLFCVKISLMLTQERAGKSHLPYKESPTTKAGPHVPGVILSIDRREYPFAKDTDRLRAKYPTPTERISDAIEVIEGKRKATSRDRWTIVGLASAALLIIGTTALILTSDFSSTEDQARAYAQYAATPPSQLSYVQTLNEVTCFDSASLVGAGLDERGRYSRRYPPGTRLTVMRYNGNWYSSPGNCFLGRNAQLKQLPLN